MSAVPKNPAGVDRLPPHSLEAERGVVDGFGPVCPRCGEPMLDDLGPLCNPCQEETADERHGHDHRAIALLALARMDAWMKE